MTQPGIEPKSPGPSANTLTIMPISRSPQNPSFLIFWLDTMNLDSVNSHCWNFVVIEHFHLFYFCFVFCFVFVSSFFLFCFLLCFCHFLFLFVLFFALFLSLPFFVFVFLTYPLFLTVGFLIRFK